MLSLQNLDEESLEQAQRAAEAAESTAQSTLWLTVATFLLFAGAVVAAAYARKTWRATKGQLELAEGIARSQEAFGVECLVAARAR